MLLYRETSPVAYVGRYPSPLGEMTMTGDEQGLTGLWFSDMPDRGVRQPARPAGGELPVFRETAAWLDAYFSGQTPDFMPPLAVQATPFCRAVWEQLLTIPYGHAVTYGGIARRLAGEAEPPGLSARAVGGAVGRNPILLLIPCHRVVGAGGRLTGYAGGLPRKSRLLRLEGALGPVSTDRCSPLRPDSD